MKNYPKVIFFDRIFCIQIQEIIMERNIIGDLLRTCQNLRYG